MRRYKKNNTAMYLMIFILVVVAIGIGYAFLNKNLKINGTSNIAKNASWDVHFEDITMITNTTNSSAPSLTEQDTIINFTANLKVPTDEYSFSANIVNDGTIDAMVSEVVKSNLTTSQAKYIDFSVTYLDGTAINKKDKLAKGTSLPIKVKVKYKDDINAIDLPTTDESLSLSVTIAYMQADSSANEVKMPDFATDSWEKIISVVQSGGGSLYEVGDTKKVVMGDFGTHTLRIANTSTPAECSTAGFSQTACGFVLEFADVITKYKMNSTSTNTGGWPASELYTYVQNDIYNALPSDLKSKIIDTYVVSGHGPSHSANFTSTDKLYLLSTKEVWGSNPGRDTATAETRQLDYYKEKGVTTSNYGGAKKQYNGSISSWWLRAAYSTTGNIFYIVNTNGDWRNYSASSTDGVAPAFRIG